VPDYHLGIGGETVHYRFDIACGHAPEVAALDLLEAHGARIVGAERYLGQHAAAGHWFGGWLKAISPGGKLWHRLVETKAGLGLHDPALSVAVKENRAEIRRRRDSVIYNA